MVKNPPVMWDTWIRSLGPLQYGLENSMDRGAWQATVNGVTKSDKTEWLSLSLSNIQEPVPKDMDKSVKDEKETRACMQDGFNWILFSNWIALPVPVSWIM